MSLRFGKHQWHGLPTTARSEGSPTTKIHREAAHRKRSWTGAPTQAWQQHSRRAGPEHTPQASTLANTSHHHPTQHTPTPNQNPWRACVIACCICGQPVWSGTWMSRSVGVVEVPWRGVVDRPPGDWWGGGRVGRVVARVYRGEAPAAGTGGGPHQDGAGQCPTAGPGQDPERGPRSRQALGDHVNSPPKFPPRAVAPQPVTLSDMPSSP